MSKSLYEYWKEFAEERNGTCKFKKTAIGIGGMNSWKVFIISLPHNRGEIKYIISEASPLKIHYDFDIDLDLNFLIYPEDWMDKAGKLFGLKEYEVGIEDFDKKFIVKGSSLEFVSKVFDKKVRDFLLNNKSLSNLRMESIEGYSRLELNSPFNVANFTKLAKSYEFLRNIVDNIYEFYKAKANSAKNLSS